jgi:hypothetical protein
MSILNQLLNGEEPKKPKTLLSTVLDVNKDSQHATDVQLGQYGVGESKYDIGVTPENVNQLDEIRGQRQSSIAKLGSGFANAVTQTGLDILKDTSYLLDFENYTDFTKSSEEGFNNWFAESIQKIEDKVKLPVYRTKASEGFSPLSAGWWGENIPSIVSTVSMLVPAEGAVMGLSKIGKTLGGEKLIKGIEGVSGLTGLEGKLKGVSGAIISRQMENIMEGGQTFQDTYDQALKAGKTEEEAKQIAGEAAANNYKLNWINLATDLPQYMLLHKSFKQSIKDQQIGFKDLLKTMGQEGSEEGYQFITNEETKRAALVKSGVLEDDKSNLTDRLKEYAKDGDLWTSVFLGGLGGGIFTGVAKFSENRNIEKMQSQYETLAKMHAALIKGDEESFNRASDETFTKELVSSIKEDNLDSFKDVLNRTIEVPEDTDDRISTQKKIAERKEIIKFAEDYKNTIASDNTKPSELKALELGTAIENKVVSKRLNDINNKINTLRSEDQVSLGLNDPTLYQFKTLKLEYEAIKDIPQYSKKAKELAIAIDNNYKMLVSEGVYKTKEDIDKQLVSVNDAELTNLYKNKEIDSNTLKATKDRLYLLSTPEGKETLQKEFTKLYKQQEEEKIQSNQEAINMFADMLSQGVKISKPEDLQFYENNKEAIEKRVLELKQAETSVPQDLLDILNKQEENEVNTIAKKDAVINDSTLFDKEEALNSIDEEYENTTLEHEEQINKIQEVQENKENTITNATDGVVPEITAKDRRNIQNSYKEALEFTNEAGDTTSSQGKIITLGDLITPAANSIAYLSKDYKEETANITGGNVTRKLTDVSEGLNSNLQEPMLLSNTQYQVGDSLILEVDTAFNIVKSDKTVISYEQTKDNPYLVPIKISNTEGKIIGYLHTLDWINEANVSNINDNINKQRELLKALREDILSNGAKTVTIDSKSFGKLNTTLGNEDKLTSETIKDPNVKFVIGKDNQFFAGIDNPLTGELPVNKNIVAGLTYMIVNTPVKGKTVALPVFNNKIDDRTANTLANATEAFLTQNKKLGDDIYNQLGIDILTNNGLRQFFNLFIATNSFTKQDLANNIGNDNKLFLDVLGSGIQYGVGGDNISEVAVLNYWRRDHFLENIKKGYIGTFLKHLDKGEFKYVHINNNKSIDVVETTYKQFIKENTQTNISDILLPDGSYTTFIQPVITFKTKEEIVDNTFGKVTNESNTKISDKGDLGEIDFDSIDPDNEDLLPISLTNEQANNIAKESKLINGFTASKQAQIINMMNHYILKNLKEYNWKEDKEKKGINSYKQLKELFIEKTNIIVNGDRKKQYVVDEFKKIVNQFDKFAEQSKQRLLLFNVKETVVPDILGFEELEANNEKENFDDGATFQIDSKDSMSSRLKQFLSFVPSPNKSYLGMETYLSYDEVVNYLSGQLAGLEASYEDISVRLDELALVKPWISTVKNLLDSSSDQVKNEFVQWATKHYTGFKIAEMFGDVKKGLSIKIMDSDQNSVVKIILNKWLVNLKNNPLVKEKTPGELIIDNSKRQELVDEINSIPKTDLEAIRAWLGKIGIDVSINVLNALNLGKSYIYKGKKIGLTFNNQFTENKGIFKNIIDNLSKSTIDTDDSFETNNPLLNNSGIKKLANLEATYSETYFSNSFKSGEGKTIYSYSANKYFINQFNKLKRNKDQYVNKLLETSFSSTSAWGKQLTNPNSYFSEVFNYFYLDTLKFNKNSNTLANMSSREHELTKLGLFWNQNNGSSTRGRISHFLFPTMSDKSTMTGITALRYNTEIRFNEDKSITIGKDTVDAVYTIAEAEYKRILASYNTTNDIDRYNPDRFYFFKELNNDTRFALWDMIPDENGKNKKVLKPLNQENQAIVKAAIEQHIQSLIKAKKQHWLDLGLTTVDSFKYSDKTYIAAVKGNLRDVNKNMSDVITYTAADFVINSLIANANMFQLFTGDPALYFKKTYEETWIDIGKRLAGEIAPGLELADSKDNSYTQAFIRDAHGDLSVSANYNQIEKLLGKELADPYKKIEGTDAQEYTTLKEHLYVLEKSGKISPERTLELLDKEDKGTLDNFDYSTIFQPVKPVYVNTLLTPSMDVNRKIYIKSSSFPLVKGLSPEMDKLRQQMIDQGIDRLAFKTATKVGGPKSYIEIFNQDGSIKNDIQFSNKLVLPRNGFRIQQDVPFDIDKENINRGTQESKLLFANILDVNGFQYDSETLVGRDLQAKYNELNKELFNNAKEALLADLMIDGELNLQKVQSMLEEEAIGRSWPQNDIDALKLINIDKFGKLDFALPLWSSTSSNRIEALLNSLVDNKIRKQKFRGNSFVLGSEEGFKGLSKNIIYTSSYNPVTGLLPQRLDEKTGKVLPAQVLITNKLKDEHGKPIDLKGFINEQGLLNLDRLDPEILKIFGFRIPTQGHNSMSYVEIVGFLPQYMGDLVIAPKDYTKQMGSDFDVDKLYTYMYNTKYNNEGKLVKEDTSSKKIIQNKILDIHFSVMSNEKVLPAILSPLGFGDLPDLATRVDKARHDRLFNVRFQPTNLNDTYQKEKYMKARGGKSGTGVKSLDSVFTAISQERDLYLRTSSSKEETPIYLTFGNDNGSLIEQNNISSKNGISGKSKLEVVAAYQSASVDNEKEQLLEKINSNDYTFDSERAFAAVGFDENYIVPLTAQDILFEYVSEMSRAQDTINDEFIARPEESIVQKLIDKYANEGGITPSLLESINDPDYPLTKKEMWDAIELGDKDPNYYKTQIRSLAKFNKAREIGKEISNIQLTINTDSSGISPSLIESNAKEQKVDRLATNKFIANATNLLDNTINGYATNDALRVANSLWYELFPYGQRRVNDIFDEIQLITGKQVLTNDERYLIFNNMKSFIYSKQSLGLENESVEVTRAKLFFDTKDNKSLATQVKELQKISKNPFILRLMVEPDVTGTKPSLIKYNAGAGENFDELSVYQGFTDLFVNPVTRELAQNMVTYFYLSGGIQQAIQFGKYIPNAYLTNIDFAKNLREVKFDDESLLGINDYKDNYYDVSNFTKQYLQHNVGKAIRLKEDLSQIKNIVRNSDKIITEFSSDSTLGKDILVVRQMPDGTTLTVLPEFVNLEYKLYQYTGNGKYVLIDTLGTFGYSEYDQNRFNVSSMILANKSNKSLPVKEIKTDTRDNIEKGIKEVTNNQLPIDRVKQYKLNDINDSLSIISEYSTNKLHRELAKQVQKNIGELPKISITDRNLRGSYNYSTKTININPSQIESDEEFERTLLHESLHHITGNVINNPKTSEQQRIVKSLQGLQNALKDRIASNPEWQASYDEFVKNYNNNLGVDDIQVSKNYGAMKLTEFVTMAMTDLEFQKILNDIPFSGSKTLLDRFIELVKNILNSVGFTITPGSVLEHSVENIVELINLTNPDFVESEKSSNLEDQLPTTNELPQLNPCN